MKHFAQDTLGLILLALVAMALWSWVTIDAPYEKSTPFLVGYAGDEDLIEADLQACSAQEKNDRLCIEDPDFFKISISKTDAMLEFMQEYVNWVKEYPEYYKGENLTDEDYRLLLMGHLLTLTDNYIIVLP